MLKTVDINAPQQLTLIDLYKLGFAKVYCPKCEDTTLHEPFKTEVWKGRTKNKLRCTRANCGLVVDGLPKILDLDKGIHRT